MGARRQPDVSLALHYNSIETHPALSEEHKNRMPNCPFFTAIVTPEEDQEEETMEIVVRTEPPKSKASTSQSRSGRAYTRTASQSKRIAATATASASEAEPGEDDIVAPAVSKKKPPLTASLQSDTVTSAGPPRRVLKSVSSKRLKTEDEDMELVVDDTEEPPQQPAPKLSSKAKKGKAKSTQTTEPSRMDVQELDPPAIKAPHPASRPPPPEPSQSVPVVVPKLALKPISRASRPSRDEDVDLKAAEDELDNMAMELDPTGSLIKSKTSSSRPPSSRSDVKPPKVSSASSSQHQGQGPVLQVPSLGWLKTGPKTMPRVGSVRAMMMEDEIEEEEVAQSLKETEEEGAVDLDTVTYSRNAERPPTNVPLPQTNGRHKTPVEHTTSSSSSAKGKARAIDPLHSEPAPPEPRTPPPVAVTNPFPLHKEVDHLPSFLLPDETSIHHLTEAEKDMTLEAFIRLEIERRKEDLRADGQRWIDEFLAYAERAKDTIRTM